MQIEQHVDRNLTEDQRVGSIELDLLEILGEHAAIDETLDVTGAQQTVPQPQERQREWNVELHAECRRGEDQAANGWRIIMHPRRRDHCTQTVGEYDRVV